MRYYLFNVGQDEVIYCDEPGISILKQKGELPANAEPEAVFEGKNREDVIEQIQDFLNPVAEEDGSFGFDDDEFGAY